MQPTLDRRGIEEAIQIGQSRLDAERARFHAVYRITVARPPVDWIDVITPYYRVALAVNSRDELPPDPQTFERTTEKGPRSVWGVIQSPPQLPVIADGLFPHYTRPASPATFEADIQLPNITCEKCTLQVVQFMADHAYNQPGGYSYHHCADIAITADPAKPLDKGWPAPVTTAARQ